MDIEELQKKIAGLEKQIQNQQILTEILIEFARSVANTERRDLISYQQFHSPSTDSCEKVRMLLNEVRKFGQSTFYEDRMVG